MANEMYDMTELQEKAFQILQSKGTTAGEDGGGSSKGGNHSNDLGPPDLGLVGLAAPNYEEVVSAISQVTDVAAVTQTASESGATDLGSSLRGLTVTKYEEVGSDAEIVVMEDAQEQPLQAPLTSLPQPQVLTSQTQNEQGAKPTIDSEEIAKLVEVATKVDKDPTESDAPPPQELPVQKADLTPALSFEGQEGTVETPPVAKRGPARFVSTIEEARKVIEAHEILTGTKYVLWRGLSGFGTATPKAKGRRIMWQEMKNSNNQMRHGIENDGTPFMVCGEIIYDCVHGSDQHKSWKTLYSKRQKEMEEKGTPVKTRKRISMSKKVGCPAKIYLKEVIKFPEYTPTKLSNFRTKSASKKLRTDLLEGVNVNYERRIYVSLPTLEDHKFHLIGGNMAEVSQVTYRAPINIAVVKYWGKRNTALNLPLNSSLSVTLGMDQLCAKTTIAVSKNFNEDKFWLNGKKQDIRKDERTQRCLKEIRKMTKKRKGSKDKDCLSKQHVHICSENNFPTAAGLASSAAGYACLTAALSKLLGASGELSHIARQGSGSACRSMYGGFVKWNRGENEDGLDSIGLQVAPENHWPELRILILIVNDQKKKVSSTEGMQRSAATSELLWYRAAYVVPMRIEEMEKAILEKDFDKFAELTMKESSQLHAVCLDTYPSIEPPYLNETSHQIMELITTLNEASGRIKAAFTFDAGPNAFVFTTEEFIGEVASLVESQFKPEGTDGENFMRGLAIDGTEKMAVDENVTAEINRRNLTCVKGAIKYAICTKCGSDPQELPFSESLLNPFGLPIENQNLCENTQDLMLMASATV